MNSYLKMNRSQLQTELAAQKQLYAREQAAGHKLDMTRGKPDATQLNLSMAMLQQNPYDLIYSRKGTDVRNYGELAGVDEAKELFAALEARMGQFGRHIVAVRVRDPSRPDYGLGAGRDGIAVLDAGPVTGSAQVTAIVSGVEYDANNMRAASADDVPDGTLILRKVEE